jgi:nitronate monooxygenase
MTGDDFMSARTDLLELLGHCTPDYPSANERLRNAAAGGGGVQSGSIGLCGLRGAAVGSSARAGRDNPSSDEPAVQSQLFVHARPRINPGETARVRAELAPYLEEFGLGPIPEPAEPFSPFDQEWLDLIVELRPRVVSFHFGLPEMSAVRRLKEAGCVVLSSATTAAEARWLEANGADVIIAQGFDAGGHRGNFSGSPGAGMVGTMASVPQIVDAVRVPVVAAGGMADGRGIAAAFALGASGVQMGTAFLACPEATVSPLYRARLRAATDEITELTRAFTGRVARAMRNRFVAEIADTEPPDFPPQASLVGPLSQLPNDEARAAFLPFWSGQAAPLVRDLPAGQLVEKLAAEALAIIGQKKVGAPDAKMRPS